MSVRILVGDCRESLAQIEAGSVQCCVTSPPYFGLRDYGHPGQLGLESTPREYVEKMVSVFVEVKRVLRDDGTLWLNIGDSYCAPNGRSNGGTYTRGPNSQLAHMHGAQEVGIRRGFGEAKAKDLLGIPWMLAFALRADGWYLRSDIIWHKPNPMPESVTDRPTKSHEYLFLLSKSERYAYNADAISSPAAESSIARLAQPSLAEQAGSDRVPGRREDEGKYLTNGVNARTVWTIATQPFKGAHFATFPPALIEPCIKAGSKTGDTILDPFGGAGTTGLVADRLGRNAILCELNPEYAELARKRIHSDNPLFTEVA